MMTISTDAILWMFMANVLLAGGAIAGVVAIATKALTGKASGALFERERKPTDVSEFGRASQR